METSGGQSSVGSVAERPQIEFDDDLFKELGFDLESREKTLNELEAMFGGRVFYYGEYSGTVADMANSCPAFGDILEQGAPSAAAWLEANDQPLEAKNEEDDKKLDDLEEPPEARSEKAETQPQPKVETNAKAVIADKPKTMTDEAQSPSAVSAEDNQMTDRSDEKPDHLSQNLSNKSSEAPVETATASDAKADPVESVSSDQVPDLNTHVSDGDGIISGEALQVTTDKQDDDKKSHVSALDISGNLALVGNDFAPPVHEESVGSVDTSKVGNIKVDDSPSENIIDTKETLGLADPLSEAEEAAAHSLVGEVAPDKTEYEPYWPVDTPGASEESVDETVADNHPDIETILSVMTNEINKPKDEADTEPQVISGEISEPEVLPAEVLELLSELISETPELTVEASIAGLRQQAALTVKAVGVLEKSKTAEECKEALGYIRIELANLLMLLGYKNTDALADQLVKQYGMQTLKEYIMLLMKYLAQSQEVVSGKTRQANHSISPRHYGVHAVRTVVSLTFGSPKLQTAQRTQEQ